MEVGQGVLVRGGDVVEEAVVAAGAGGAIGLGDHVQQGGPGRCRLANDPYLSSLAK